MKEIIIKSDSIILRKTTLEDLDFVIKLERDSENAKFVGQWSREQHIASLKNSDILHLIIEDAQRNKAIGYLIMAGIENSNKSIEFRRLVLGEKGYGFGKKTLSLIKEYSFNKLNAHRLWLDVRFKNTRAQGVYKSQGFKEEGVLRECIFYNNNYESLIVMSILESEYRENN